MAKKKAKKKKEEIIVSNPYFTDHLISHKEDFFIFIEKGKKHKVGSSFEIMDYRKEIGFTGRVLVCRFEERREGKYLGIKLNCWVHMRKEELKKINKKRKKIKKIKSEVRSENDLKRFS